MEDVALETGLAKPVIYRLGGGRQTLIDAALSLSSEHMRTALVCWPYPREVVGRALAFARAEPDLFLFLMAHARGSPATAQAYGEILDMTARQLLVLVWQGRGRAPACKVRAAFAFGALLHEAMIQQARAKSRADERFLDWCETMIQAWASATKAM
jgi:AcrR family transcriptional regulator